MITLEISSTEIRLMEINEGKIEKWASHPLEPGMFEEEVVTDPQALGSAVKQLMASSGIKERNVTASVSSLYSLSRIVTVPTPLEGSVTEQTVLEAASEVMPLSEEEMYLSWRTISTGEGGQQVLVVGVPKDVIDNEVRALRAVGVNPRILDLKTMALARAVNREQALILNIEPTSFDIVMIVAGVAEILRTTAWQQEDLSVEERADYLVSALELTVNFYNSHRPGYPLDPATPLFITGQMSGDLALMKKLQAGVQYPIEPLAPPLEYPAHLSISQYAVNIGLALKATAASKNIEPGGHSLPNINLLPQVYKPWRPSARQIFFSCAIIAAIALLFPLYQVTSEAIAKTSALERKYTSLNSLLEVRKAALAERQPLKNAIADYNTIVNMGGGFTEDIEVIRSQAEELGVEVQSITREANSINISCQADSYTTFRDYLTALEESGRFATPIPPPEGFPYVKSGPIKLKPKP